MTSKIRSAVLSELAETSCGGDRRPRDAQVTARDRRRHALPRVVDILEAAQRQVARSVNTAMVHAYWLIGREIVEVEQRGDKRAGYGDRVIAGLAARLADRSGRGFGVPSLKRMRRFLLAYPRGSTLPEALGTDGQEISTVSPTSKIGSAVLTQLAQPAIWQALPAKSSERVGVAFPPYLGWTHYLILIRVSNPTARAFYEIEAVREGCT